MVPKPLYFTVAKHLKVFKTISPRNMVFQE
jgi:hypothetical protein